MYYDPAATGERIQNLRKDREVTQEQLAIDLNISDRYMRNLEKGEKVPSVDLFVELRERFGSSLDYIVLGVSASQREQELQDQLQMLRKELKEMQRRILVMLEILGESSENKGENAMMLSNLNLSSLPECNFEVRYVDSVLLNPCAEYQRLLRMGKVAKIAANFSEYIANEPKVSYRDGRYFVFDGQNTIEARKTCNGGRDLPIRCKVFYGLSKEHEALLFAVQTGISSELTAGEQLRAKLVAHEENACNFVSVTEDTGVRFALDGIRAPWKIYCIRSAYYIYKSYGAALYREMLSILVDAWGGDSDSFLSGILHGMARFLALYQGEYSRERLILRLRTVHPKTITRLAQNDTGNVADRHMKQILSIYNGAGRTHNLPCKR